MHRAVRKSLPVGIVSGLRVIRQPRAGRMLDSAANLYLGNPVPQRWSGFKTYGRVLPPRRSLDSCPAKLRRRSTAQPRVPA
jgi:hypothetical protein